MGKRFLKGMALGGLLAGLGVWMHTTPKGKEKKEDLEKKIADLWKTAQKEYAAGHPNGMKDLKKDLSSALRTWKKAGLQADVKKALAALSKKLG